MTTAKRPMPKRTGSGKPAAGSRKRPAPARGFPGEKVKIFKP